jgi:hypothetical protein
VAKFTSLVIGLIGLQVLVGCGDVGLRPESVEAKNQIIGARATQIATETQDRHAEAAMKLEFQGKRHEQDLTVRALVLPIAYGIALFAALALLVVVAGRIILDGYVALVHAKAALASAEARQLEAERDLAHVGPLIAAPGQDDSDGGGQPSPDDPASETSTHPSTPPPADRIRSDLAPGGYLAPEPGAPAT